MEIPASHSNAGGHTLASPSERERTSDGDLGRREKINTEQLSSKRRRANALAETRKRDYQLAASFVWLVISPFADKNGQKERRAEEKGGKGDQS